MQRPNTTSPRLRSWALGLLVTLPGFAASGAEPPSPTTSAAQTPTRSPGSTSSPAAVDPRSVISSEAAERIVAGQKPGLASSPEGVATPRIRQREGAKFVDRRGRFETRGDRVVFLATNPDAHFVVLENLALERVSRVLDESGSQLEWSVSGTITEFRSSNYLQISRALVKSLPAKGEPRKLADPLASQPLAPAKPSGFTAPSATR